MMTAWWDRILKVEIAEQMKWFTRLPVVCVETYIYIGETSKNTQMHSKSKQHMEDMHRNSEDSVLMRYRREKHEGG